MDVTHGQFWLLAQIKPEVRETAAIISCTMCLTLRAACTMEFQAIKSSIWQVKKTPSLAEFKCSAWKLVQKSPISSELSTALNNLDFMMS